MTRLLAEAKKGDTSITIAKDLDLVAGDRIALAATSFEHTAGEEAIVKDYVKTTG